MSSTLSLDEIKRHVSIVDELARRGIQPARRNGKEFIYRCPLPGHDDTKPSFTVSPDKNQFYCFGCNRGGTVIDLVMYMNEVGVAEAVRILGGALTTKQPASCKDKTSAMPSKNGATLQRVSGCTLAELAASKGLSPELLKKHGWRDYTYRRRAAVRIPYYDADGAEGAVQYRLALHKGDGERFRWRSNDKPTLYGLHRLDWIRECGQVVIVEGATDVLTLWLHDIPALGLPSAHDLGKYASHLSDLASIYVVVEPDKGGEAVEKGLAKFPSRSGYTSST